MKRLDFLKSILLVGALPNLLVGQILNPMKTKNSIRLIRHATLLLQLGNKRILIDPMLSAKGEMDPVQNCGNDIRIPMVDLPMSKEELTKMLTDVDAVFITHIHRDHWDPAAQKLINKELPIFCQPGDEEKIKEQGFKNVTPIDASLAWEGIQIHRTEGQHGTGEIGKKMGHVSGFVFKTSDTTIYVAGDSIWCEAVEDALQKFKPDMTVLNAGGAKFLMGDPITMTPQDIISVHKTQPQTTIIAVHMDTVNHCFVKRADLQQIIEENDLASRIRIPSDGELINLE